MANNITKFVLPNGLQCDLRDDSSVHFLGKTTTALTDGAVTNPISINGSNVTAVANDWTVNSTTLQQFLFNGISWVAVSEMAGSSISSIAVDGTAITPDASGQVNIDAVPASILTTGTTITDGVLATTQTAGDNSSKVATTAYVDSAINALPEPMVFRGTVGAAGDSPTITALPVDGSASVGDTYKVITDGTYASQDAEVGDTFICQTKTSNANTWVLIPSGDEPAGTVTSVAAGTGLTTNQTLGGPITDSGEIKVNLASETALSGSKIYNVGVNSSGQLAVQVPWEDTSLPVFDSNNPYDEDTNPAATVRTVMNVINDLDGGIIGTGGTAKTLTALSQTDGNVSATFADISIPVAQVNDVTANTTIKEVDTVNTVATAIAAAAPGSTAPANSVTYYAYDSATETLSLYQLGYTTGAAITTNNVENVVKKNSSSVNGAAIL